MIDAIFLIICLWRLIVIRHMRVLELVPIKVDLTRRNCRHCRRRRIGRYSILIVTRSPVDRRCTIVVQRNHRPLV